MVAALGQRRFDEVGVLDRMAHEDLRWSLAREVVLLEEGAQRLALAAQPALQKKVRAAEVPAAAQEDDGDAAVPPGPGQRHGVDVLAGDARHRLAGLDLLQHGDLVAQPRGLLELQTLRRRIHATSQVDDDLVVASLENAGRIRHVLRIRLLRDEPDAGRRAALDLVLQAGPRAVREERVLARTDAEQFLQQQQRLAGRDAVRVRAEEPSRLLARAAEVGQSRILVGREVNEREALVVLQQHVVTRPMALDQVELEQQRLDLGGRDGHLDARDLPD